MKEFWDFDEKINYTTVNIQGKPYKVINKYSNYIEAAKLLHYIYFIIFQISTYLYINRYKYSKLDQTRILCFTDIHNGNFLLSEMQLNTPFNGLNKPKNVHSTNKENVGPDKKLRAEYRDIFLTLRKSNGEFKSMSTIMNLVIHEITHTMCNHVRWRDDDHGEDFQHCEKIIKDAYKKILQENTQI